MNGIFRFQLKMIESLQAVELDGIRPEKVKRTWKERLFTLPWKPWITHKTIQVPNYKPAMYRLGNQIIYHPALKEQIRKSIEVYNNSPS